MAGFNLTAQINLRGPGNVKKVVAGIQKQLSGLKADVNLNIGKGTLNTLQSANKKLLAINSSLQKVSSNAKQANAAVGQFAQTINSIGTGNVSVKIQAASKATQQLGKNAGITFKNLKVARTEIEEFGRQSALAIRRFTAFASVTSVIYGVNNAINQALSDFIKFDRQLVRIAQVSGQTVGNLKGLQGTIGELATGIGVSSSSLAEVSVTLTQAGFSIREVEKALKALALTDVAPTFNNLNDTVQGSIALLRQFSIGTGQLEASLSSINAVAAQFAVESSDIISAIQRAGGVFAAASRGVSEGTDALNEFIAIFTSVRATTREGAETIATGLRTIFTRLQRESTIDALKEFGVNLQDAEGKFVGAYKAVQLLSEGLGSLDPRDIRFSKIVEELGGFRQIGKVIPLIGQFATAQEALRVAQTGQDSLAKSNAQAQAALAVQFARVREEFLRLVRDIAGTDSFKGLISGALSLASAMIKVADAVKGVIPIIGLLAAAKGASAITQFAKGFGGGLRRTQGFARGGTVPGTGNTDSVPAMLTPGEFVLRKSAVRAIGTEKLHKMNKYGSGDTVKDIANTAGVSKQLLRSISRNREQPFRTGVATNANDRFTANISYDSTSRTEVENYIKKLPKKKQDSFRSRIFGKNKELKGEAFEQYLSAKKTKAARTSSISKTYPVDFHSGSFYGEAKNVHTKLNENIFIDKLYRARVLDGSYKNRKDQAGRPPSSESGQNINLGKIKVFYSKFAKGGFAEAPIVDDITQASGSILPRPGSAIQSLIASGGGAVDIDRTLKRTIGDKAYAKARTRGQETASLNKYFRDASVRLNDIKSAPLTKFGEELKSAIQSRQLDPKKISIISKSSRVKGVAEYLSELFGIPTANMIFTQGGSKQPALDAMRSKGPRVNRVKMATGGSVQDTVPAMLTPGEFVFSKESANRIGYGNLRKMNTRPQGFNKGGVVGYANGGLTGVRGGDIRIGSGLTGQLEALEQAFVSLGLPVDQITKAVNNNGKVSRQTYLEFSKQAKANVRLAKASAQTTAERKKAELVEKQLAAVRSGVAQQKTGSALLSNANSFANSQAFTSLILGAGGAAVALESLNTPLTSFGSTLISSTASFVTAMVAATSAATNFARTGFAQKIGGVLGKIPGIGKLGGVFLKAIPVVGAVTTAFGLVTGVVQAYYSYQRKQIELARKLTKAGLERATESAAKALEKFSKDASAINFAEVNRRIADQIAAGNADAEQIGKSVRLERQDTTGISGTMRELGAYITFGYIDSIEDATRQNEDKVKAAAKQLADTYAPALQNAQNVVFQKLAAGATIKDLENAPAGSEEAKALNNLVEAALAADQTYQEQVALAAQQGKQLTAQQINANRERIRSELLTGNGTIALRDKLEQAARAQERLGRLQARLATSFEKLNNAVQQSANLINFEAQNRQSAIDSSIAAARGEASITEIRSRTANVLDNPLAYTPQERADTRADLTRNLTPALGESRAREVSALSTFDAAAIDKSFADVANNVAVAAAPSEISEQIQDNLALEIDKLRAAGATDAANNLQQQANEAASVLAQKLQKEEDPTKRQTLIDETLEDLKKNFNEVRNQAVNLAKTFEQTRINAFNQFAKNLAQAANLQNEALKYQQAAINASRNASDSINEALTGFGPSVRELTARQDADTARLTGGPTDPAGIKANFDALKASSSSLQQAFDDAVAAGDTAEAERLARELTAVNNQLNNNRAALERLAESASKAAEAALAEVNERKRLQDANRQFAETLLTSGPEELKKLDESLVRANQRVNGFIPQAGASQRKRFFELLKQTGSVQQASQGVAAETRAEDLKFLQQTRDVRIMNMQDMGMTLEEATQRANQDESRILGQMGAEAGLGRLGRQIVGRAAATTADRRNDPVMRDLITQYQNAAAVQQQANEQLSLIASGAANEALVESQKNLRTSIDDLNARIAGADERSRPDGVNPGRGQVPAYRAAGGSIFQPRGTDTVPAMLTPGEFVVNRKATQKNMGLLQAINGGQVNTYSKGGKVLYLRGGGFAARDTNKDGVITVGVEDASGLTDTNNDGRISFAEYMNTQSVNDPRMKDAVNKINQRLVKTGSIQNPQQYLAHEQYVDMIETFGPIAEELANYATQNSEKFLKRYQDYKAHMESGLPNDTKARERWFKKRDEFLSDSAFAWYAATAQNTDPTGQKTSDFLGNVASGKARAPGIFQIGNRALDIYQQKFDENINKGMNPNDAREGALDYLYTDTALAAYPGTREAVTRMAERRDTYRAIRGGGGTVTRLRASHQAGLQAARKAQREGKDPQKAYNETRNKYLEDKAQEYKDRRIKQHVEGRGAKPLSNQELKDMGYSEIDIGLMNTKRFVALSEKEGTEEYKLAQEAKRRREREERRRQADEEIKASRERIREESRKEEEAKEAARKQRLEEFKASPEGIAFQAEIDQRMQKVRDDFDAKRAAEASAKEGKVFDISTRKEIDPVIDPFASASAALNQIQIQAEERLARSFKSGMQERAEQLRIEEELQKQKALEDNHKATEKTKQWQAVQKHLVDDIEGRMEQLKATGKVKTPARGGGTKEYQEYEKLRKRLEIVKAGGRKGTVQLPLAQARRGKPLTPEQIKYNEETQKQNELLAFATSFYNDEGLMSPEALAAAAEAPGVKQVLGTLESAAQAGKGVLQVAGGALGTLVGAGAISVGEITKELGILPDEAQAFIDTFGNVLTKDSIRMVKIGAGNTVSAGVNLRETYAGPSTDVDSIQIKRGTEQLDKQRLAEADALGVGGAVRLADLITELAADATIGDGLFTAAFKGGKLTVSGLRSIAQSEKAVELLSKAGKIGPEALELLQKSRNKLVEIGQYDVGEGLKRFNKFMSTPAVNPQQAKLQAQLKATRQRALDAGVPPDRVDALMSDVLEDISDRATIRSALSGPLDEATDAAVKQERAARLRDIRKYTEDDALKAAQGDTRLDSDTYAAVKQELEFRARTYAKNTGRPVKEVTPKDIIESAGGDYDEYLRVKNARLYTSKEVEYIVNSNDPLDALKYETQKGIRAREAGVDVRDVNRDSLETSPQVLTPEQKRLIQASQASDANLRRTFPDMDAPDMPINPLDDPNIKMEELTPQQIAQNRAVDAELLTTRQTVNPTTQGQAGRQPGIVSESPTTTAAKQKLTTSLNVSAPANTQDITSLDVGGLPKYDAAQMMRDSSLWPSEIVTSTKVSNASGSIPTRRTKRTIPEGPLDTRDPTAPIQQTSETISAGAIPGTGPIDVSAGSMRGAGTTDVQAIPTIPTSQKPRLTLDQDTEYRRMLREGVDREEAAVIAQRFNNGGIVYASNGALMPFKSRGTDTVPAMLTPGEFVVNRDATSKFLPTLRAINNGYSNHNQMVNHLAGGGIVKGPQYLQAGGITGRGANNGVSVGSKIEGMEEFKAMIAEFNQAVSGGTENMNNVVSQISQASTAFSATAQSVNEAATNIPDRVNVAQNLRVDGIPETLNDFSNNLLNSSVAQSTQQTAQQFNDLNTKNEGSLGLPSPNNNAFIA